MNFNRKEARVRGASFAIFSTTEEENTGRIVVVRLAEVAPVVEVQVVIVGLEVERVIRRLPKICLFPPAIHRKSVKPRFLNFIRSHKDHRKKQGVLWIYSATLIFYDQDTLAYDRSITKISKKKRA